MAEQTDHQPGDRGDSRSGDDLRDRGESENADRGLHPLERPPDGSGRAKDPGQRTEAGSRGDVKVTNNPEHCIDNSRTTTTSAPNSPIANAQATVQGEKVKGWFTNVLLAL